MIFGPLTSIESKSGLSDLEPLWASQQYDIEQVAYIGEGPNGPLVQLDSTKALVANISAAKDLYGKIEASCPLLLVANIAPSSKARSP